MQVTATEFKLNLDKYLELVQTEDIWVTKNGETVARLTNPNISSPLLMLFPASSQGKCPLTSTVILSVKKGR